MCTMENIIMFIKVLIYTINFLHYCLNPSTFNNSKIVKFLLILLFILIDSIIWILTFTSTFLEELILEL